MPDHELFVAGRSGTGAVDDNRRLCSFVYRNLAAVTAIRATMDPPPSGSTANVVRSTDPIADWPRP